MAGGADLRPAILLEAEGRTAELRVAERDGERWIPLDGSLLTALGGGLTAAVRLPWVTLHHGAESLAIAVGLRGARGGAGGLAWLPDPPRLHRGAVVLTPRALAAVLEALGGRATWVVPGRRLAVAFPGGRPAAVAPPVLPADPPAAGPWRVVVDAGHGGHDPGARGPGRLREKDITLDLSRRVASLLARKGVAVSLTRDDDRYLTLQERVAFARRERADLFVSLHVNASRNRSAKGVETFVYGARVSGGQDAALVKFENADANYVDIIVSDLQQQQYHDASILAAGSVEEKLVDGLRLLGRGRRRVKEAPFYVLARAHQPSVLVEVGFITNPVEARRLADPGHRARLAATIADGILLARPAAGRAGGA